MSQDLPSEILSMGSPMAGSEGAWDQEKADWLLGKYALVGVTYLAGDGETVTAQVQYHGRITGAGREDGITIECGGVWSGRTMGLPPDTTAFYPADPGDYRLRSTGEVVENPDVLASWQVTEPAKIVGCAGCDKPSHEMDHIIDENEKGAAE